MNSTLFLSTRTRKQEFSVLTPSEIQSFVPWIKTDDLEGGLYLPSDGVTDPTNTALSLAKGAKNRGIHQTVCQCFLINMNFYCDETW